jgi:kynurenine formamidase
MKTIFLSAITCAGLLVADVRATVPSEHIKDLSLLVTRELPCVWPVSMTPLAIVTTHTFGPGAYYRDLLVIDEHTGTQFDAPAHFIPPPDSGLPAAGPTGRITGDLVPVWQFCGEACVIDLSAHRDQAIEGSSYLIRPEHVIAWEKKHRPLRFGDVVLFKTGYSDRYYREFPEGDRFVASALRKDTPAWPAPAPETMTYLGEKGVMTLAIDGASMGPLPELAAATHQAGSKLGMIWTECTINLGSLPTTGAFYAMLAPKHAGGSGSECRAIGITEPKLAARLIESARQKRVVDLSVTLDENYPVTWPGRAAGDEASRYVAKTLNAFKTRGPFFAMTHLMDSQAGTHVALPSSLLPPPGFDAAKYSPDVRAALTKYEASFGSRGQSSLTIDQAPLGEMMGRAYVIDCRKLIGTTKESQWPESPSITLEIVKQHDARRPIAAGDVVIFHSGYSDQHFQPLPPAPQLDRLISAPLAGKAEGWPAPTPEVIAWLAEKGVRTIGTDGPTLGGAKLEDALLTGWLAASKGMLVVEYLTNVDELAGKDAFFIFAPVKIKGTRGGYGRAIALY